MMTVEELLKKRKQAERDFKVYFEAQYPAVDKWIREYDKWHREAEADKAALNNYAILNQEFITPTEAAYAEYDANNHVKAIKVKVMQDPKVGTPSAIALCKEGFFEEGKFVMSGESFLVPVDRLFSIFVEMLEAYDNITRMEY